MKSPQRAGKAGVSPGLILLRGLNLSASRRSLDRSRAIENERSLTQTHAPGNRGVARLKPWPFLGCIGAMNSLPESNTPRTLVRRALIGDRS